MKNNTVQINQISVKKVPNLKIIIIITIIIVLQNYLQKIIILLIIIQIIITMAQRVINITNQFWIIILLNSYQEVIIIQI